jgi:hypothetical protein
MMAAKKTIEKGAAIFAQIAAAWSSFNVPEFDTWLQSLDASKAKSALLERRELTQRFSIENIDAMQQALDYLALARYTIERGDFLLPLAKRGNAHAKGSRSQTHSEIDTWIAAQLKKNPQAKSPELWEKRPDEIKNPRDYEPIGERAFAARVTGVRKGRRGKPKKRCST